MMNSLKRKINDVLDEAPHLHWLNPSNPSCENDGLRLDAREADILSGRRSTAQALEGLGLPPGAPQKGEARGSQLLWWNVAEEDASAWVDRYDARLLLTSLPSQCQSSAQVQDGRPGSPSGWSDLPSDSEEMFFLSKEMIDDRRAAKRKKALEDARTERLAAMQSSSNVTIVEDNSSEPTTYHSDEEPDEAQLQLMQRTAAHLHASPDRTRLAARILANHGADRRFAFLRGRWRRAWSAVQQTITNEEREREKTEAAKVEDGERKDAGMTGLGDYGESDDDESSQSGRERTSSKGQEDAIVDIEEAKKAARRQRAREWSLRRRHNLGSDLAEAVQGEHV